MFIHTTDISFSKFCVETTEKKIQCHSKTIYQDIFHQKLQNKKIFLQ